MYVYRPVCHIYTGAPPGGMMPSFYLHQQQTDRHNEKTHGNCFLHTKLYGQVEQATLMGATREDGVVR